MFLATSQFGVLVAGIGDLISAILPFIVLIIWVVSQFMGGENKKKPQPARKREDELSDAKLREQIESFLREAGVETESSPPQDKDEAQAPPVVVVAPPAPDKVRSLSDYESAAPGPLVGETVDAHVAEHLDAKPFGHLDPHLGEEIDQTDERLVAHLHERFDHSLGALGRPLEIVAEPDEGAVPGARNSAREILELIRNPQDIRRAIVFSEIINRPTRRLE